MPRIIFPLIAVCLMMGFRSNGQRDHVWCFGANVGFDFNSGVPVTFATGMLWGFPAASVSDEQGKLLFYTNGDTIWNRQHQIMPNGHGLVVDPLLPAPPAFFNQYVNPDGAVMIVPMPDSSNKYYVFSLTRSGLYPYSGRLYYSVIDMDLDNGLGDVESRRKSILLDVGFSPGIDGTQLTGVTGDKCNVWLLATARSSQGDVLRAYSISKDSIDRRPVTSSINVVNRKGSGTQILLSPDRRKLAYAANVTLFDFDPYYGTVNNGVSLQEDTGPYYRYYHVAFSPDGTKLYANATSGLTTLDQFDISSGDSVTMRQSRQQILQEGGTLKLAPDGQIYISNQDIASRFLYGVISQPNQPGTSCQFIPNTPAFLPGTHSNGLSFPNVVPVIHRDTVTTVYKDSAASCDVIHLRASDTTGWNYVWNDGTIDFEKTINTTGIYWVTYYRSPCIMQVDTFNAYFFDLPKQQLGNDTLFCKKDPVSLNLNAATGEGASLLWSTGSAAISINVTDTGIYWVTLSQGPCHTSDTIYIGRQHCECSFMIPTAFSPNGDGLNDQFLPIIETACPAIRNWSLSVYDRWGREIYGSTTTTNGWNGTRDGLPAEVGTYMYEFQFEGGTIHMQYYRKGDVTLIR